MKRPMDKEASVRDLLDKLKSRSVASAVDDLAAQAGSGLGQAAVRTLEQDIGRISEQAGKEIGRVSGRRAAQEFAQAIPELVSKATAEATGAFKTEGSRLVRDASLMVGAGAMTGAALSKDRKAGASRGMAGGLLGGIAGAAWGRRFGVNPHAARMVGAAAGGALAGFLGNKEQPVHKFAGVIIDHFDDHGGTLKAIFPKPEQLPDVIKTASFREKEALPNEAFALIAVDGGHVMRKFACYDPGTTATSVIYFMEHGEKLPDDAVKVAANNLMNACARFGMLPPEQLSKMAGPTSSSLDITGQRPSVKIASSRPTSDDDFAVVTRDGRRLYPIDSWDNMKLASAYFLEHHRTMHPEIRRQFATKLAAKAEESGYPLEGTIKEAGASTFAEEGWIKAAADMRTALVDDPALKKKVASLISVKNNLGPEKYAQQLRQLDVAHGLDRYWDNNIPDPYASTFGIRKVAEVVWESGADRVTAQQLHALALNHKGAIDELFSEGTIEKWEKDPVASFKSMPEHQKRYLARLAVDMVSQGGSEGQVPITASSSPDMKEKEGSLKGFIDSMKKATPEARRAAMAAIEKARHGKIYKQRGSPKSAKAVKSLSRLGT